MANRPPPLNAKYLVQWEAAAGNWRPGQPYPADIKPDDVRCGDCWDTGLCCECLGNYPKVCPLNCHDGRCACQK